MDLQIYNCKYHLRLKLRVALQVSTCTYIFLTKIYQLVLGFFLFFEWNILLLFFFQLNIHIN